MPSRAQMSLLVSAPADRIAELIRTCAARLGWRVELINQDLWEMTFRHSKREVVRTVPWNYEYAIIVNWQEQGDSILVTADVSEDRNNHTQPQCKQMCLDLLRAVEEKAALLVERQKTKKAPTTYGSARWATEDDIAKAGYEKPEKDSTRLLLGPAASGGQLTVPAEDTAKHALVCGPTGCGKTSSIFIPNLLERLESSAIVTEATAGNEPPDLYQKTAGFREKVGRQQIYYFNPDDLTSNCINPIDYVNSIDQAQNVANLIVQNTSKKFSGGDPIWETSERHLLTALILHAAGERGNLGMVRHWMVEGPEGMGRLLSQSQVQAARDEYKAFFKNSTEGFRNGVTSGLMQRLNLWVNPRIVALTEKTDFDYKLLSEQLFTFYMAVPAQKTHLKPLSALVFNFILDLALQQHFKHPLFLSLDEFTNFGYIPAIAEKLTIIRHRKIAAMVGIQDYIQMEKVYGREDATLLFGQPGTKIFFRPRDLVTAKKISESLGDKTVVQRSMTSSGQINEREFAGKLMAAGELMNLAEDKAVCFTPKTPPILLSRYTWQDFEDMTSIKPAARRMLEVDEELKRACDQQKGKPEWVEKAEHTGKIDRPPGEPKHDRPRHKQKESRADNHEIKEREIKAEPKRERSLFDEERPD